SAFPPCNVARCQLNVGRSPLFLLLILLHFSSPATATNTIYELSDLTVHTAPGAVSLPDASSPATILDAASLTDTGAGHLQQILALAPNLTAAGGTSRPRYFQIRGIGERSQFAGEGPPNFSVGFIEDDMDLSGIGMHASLFDVAQVNILRGPQAAVFGSKALAGLMEIRTREPSATPEGRAQVTVGTDNLVGVGAAVGGPITADPNVLGARVSVERTAMDGFRNNVYLDRHDTNSREEWTTRAKLRWQPNPDVLWMLTTLWSDYDNGYDEFTPDNNRQLKTYSDNPGHDHQETYGASLRGTWMGPERFRLLSISSYTHTDSEYSYDADWGNDAYWATSPYFFDPAIEGYRYDFTEKLERTRHNTTQDFRIISEPGGEILWGSSAWHFGIYGAWLGENDDYAGFDTLNGNYDALSGASYGQISTRLTDTTVLHSALRLEERQTDYSDQQGVRFDGSDTMWGGRVALEQKLDAEVMVFGGVSRGFKGSGVNQNPALPPEQRKYDPETVWNFEAGSQATFFDGWTDIALTLFYMLRDNLQIGTSAQSDPTDPTSFVYYTDNAARGYNLGAELEARQRLTAHWELFSTLALLDTRYRDYQSADGADRLDGREQPYAPNYSYLVGSQWHGARGFFARVDAEGKDAFYLSDEHDARSDPYALLNASIGYGRGNWTLTLWGRNVLDKRYVTRGYVFGLEPPDFADTLYVTYGDPAQFGATWDIAF
ncbi:MAG: TonB-dependent receptor, partial [Verrucomicrobia bacterium]|nr:TonB-dependent receptor [Verrucomicrobiota bacterium]